VRMACLLKAGVYMDTPCVRERETETLIDPRVSSLQLFQAGNWDEFKRAARGLSQAVS
jgi:hypothetical protein